MTFPHASKHPYLRAFALLLVICVAGAHAAYRQMPQVQQAIEESRPSIVLVTSSVPNGNSDYLCSAHTGFFIDNEGRVLTSIYAVAGCGAARVHTSDGQNVDATVLAVEQASGLALLDTRLNDIEPLELAEKNPGTGAWVVSALAQDGGSNAPPLTYVLGLVMSTEGRLDLWGVRQENLTVSNLPMAHGAAGAPLLDSEGRLVGTVLAYSYGGDCRYACYALGTERLSEVLKTLKSGGRRLGWLGLTLRKASGRKGHEVGAVLENCPADTAGIKPGDVLLEIDGKTVTDPSVLVQKVVHSRPGKKLGIKILRDGEIRTATATVAPRPLLISKKRPGSESEPTAVLGSNNRNARKQERLRAFELQQDNELLQKRIRELQEKLRRLQNKQPEQ